VERGPPASPSLSRTAPTRMSATKRTGTVRATALALPALMSATNGKGQYGRASPGNIGKWRTFRVATVADSVSAAAAMIASTTPIPWLGP
jgi:hypothetical protein